MFCSFRKPKKVLLKNSLPLSDQILLVFIIILYISWYYIKPGYYKKLYQKFKQFKGFKHSHLTNQPEEVSQSIPVSNTNCSMLIYSTSGSGKTSSLKHYLDQTKPNFIKTSVEMKLNSIMRIIYLCCS